MSHPADRPQPWWQRPERLSAALGLLGAILVLLTLDGPGLTIDEPLDVRPGRTYVQTLASRGLGFFSKATVDQVFRDNAEHPPLGRWLLGIGSFTFETVEILARGGPDPLGLYVVAGRAAPALIFGLLVALVGRVAGTLSGVAGTWGASLSLILMPRVFGHAHLGALDTFIAYFWVLALVTFDRARTSDRPVRSMILAGGFFGLALLTKIHAWLLPPLTLLWFLLASRSNRKTGLTLSLWSLWLATGFVVFFLGWPWLWYDPIGRLSAYLNTGVNRVTIQTLYFGTVYADRDVPWHYPWFYFLVTVPVGLQLLGVWGTWVGLRRPGWTFSRLAPGAILLILLLFSTKAPIYDGDRLILPIFPLWAVLIGQGFGDIWARFKTPSRILLGLFVAAQGYGVVTFYPSELSYYNGVVGGLKGAESLGLELTYWTDVVDKPLLDQLAREASSGDVGALAPTLAPQQGKLLTTRSMARKPILLEDQEEAGRSRWLLVTRREAYWSPIVRERLQTDEVVAVRSRQGVWLAKLLRRKAPMTPGRILNSP